MNYTIRRYPTNILFVFLFSAFALSQPINAKKSKGNKDNKITALTIADLAFIDPGVSPFSGYRWQDVAGNLYADTYRNSYGYDDIDVQVQVTFEENDVTFNGQLVATNLKPNFGYQVKLNGFSGTTSNELIGLAGRWWQEEWDGSQWTGGQNLNDKDDGLSPNPSTMINYQLPMISDVELSVYNLLGQKIKTLVSEREEAGTSQVKWDGRSDMGKPVSNGIYYAVLSNQDLVNTINMILIK